MEMLKLVIGVVLCLFFMGETVVAQGTVMVTTTRNVDGSFTINYGCPNEDGSGNLTGSTSELGLNLAEQTQFLNLLDAFEDNNTEKLSKDNNVKTASGPHKGTGKKLCDFIREKQARAEKRLLKRLKTKLIQRKNN